MAVQQVACRHPELPGATDDGIFRHADRLEQPQTDDRAPVVLAAGEHKSEKGRGGGIGHVVGDPEPLHGAEKRRVWLGTCPEDVIEDDEVAKVAGVAEVHGQHRRHVVDVEVEVVVLRVAAGGGGTEGGGRQEEEEEERRDGLK